jgi:hypothetical protein
MEIERRDFASAYYVSAIQNGWMSINEVRESENLNPLGPDDDAETEEQTDGD